MSDTKLQSIVRSALGDNFIYKPANGSIVVLIPSTEEMLKMRTFHFFQGDADIVNPLTDSLRVMTVKPVDENNYKVESSVGNWNLQYNIDSIEQIFQVKNAVIRKLRQSELMIIRQITKLEDMSNPQAVWAAIVRLQMDKANEIRAQASFQRLLQYNEALNWSGDAIGIRLVGK